MRPIEYANVHGTTLPLITVTCCREWTVIPLARWSTCKLCGERPTAPSDSYETNHTDRLHRGVVSDNSEPA